MRETRRGSVPKLCRYICLRCDTEFFYKTDIFVSGAVGQAYIFDGGGKGVNAHHIHRFKIYFPIY